MTELKGTVTSPDGQETAPITDTKRARTTVTVRNHETAVVGGFITETVAKDKRGIPFLSNVPILGSAFTTAAKATTRTELVFMVTVNAEEPSSLYPIQADASAVHGTGTSNAPAPVRAENNRRVERIDIGGGVT